MNCDLHPDITRPCHVCGVARVRAAIAAAPRPPAPTPDQPDPVRDLAKARAALDRKDKP